jgi:hypothetical protein
MSTLAQEDPVRAIRNALERLERLANGCDPDLAAHVREERAIVETALRVIEGAPPDRTVETVRRCKECGNTFAAPADEEECAFCDLFQPPGRA